MLWRRGAAQTMERGLMAIGLLALVCFALAGCAGRGAGGKKAGAGTIGGGSSGGSGAAVQALAQLDTPRRPLEHAAMVSYVLREPRSAPVDVRVEFSTDSGAHWQVASAVSGDARHEGTVALSTSPLGARHGFVWDTDADLGAINAIHVRVRITPIVGAIAGQAAETDDFAVINLGRRDPDCDYEPSFGTLVLSVDTRGGFVPASHAINHITHTRIYGDGKVVYTDPADGDRVIYAGTLSEAQICALFKLLAEKGFWAMRPNYIAPNAPTDLPSAYIVARRRGQRPKTVSSYGGALSAPPGFMEIYRAARYPAILPDAIDRYIRVPISQWELNRGVYFGAGARVDVGALVAAASTSAPSTRRSGIRRRTGSGSPAVGRTGATFGESLERRAFGCVPCARGKEKEDVAARQAPIPYHGGPRPLPAALFHWGRERRATIVCGGGDRGGRRGGERVLHQVILAGGSGTRFWPMSRRARPKQLLALDGAAPLLVRAAGLLEGLVPPERRWVVTTCGQAEPVAAVLPELASDHIVVEPCGRDTAAAIGLGAATALRRDPDALLVVMPADHVIAPPSRFRAVIETAARLIAARPEAVVTIGIQPSFPSTAYGYIERAEALEAIAGTGTHRCYEVARFREKPDRETAIEYLASGRFFWNAGIFVWRAAAFMRALAERLPQTARALELEGEALAGAYAALPKISVDYALLEHHREVLVVEADFAWSDVGSWSALPGLLGVDAHGTTVLGARHVAIDSERLIVVGTGERVIGTIGLDDLVIVETEDATLVCRRDRVEEVKRLVGELERRGMEEVL